MSRQRVSEPEQVQPVVVSNPSDVKGLPVGTPFVLSAGEGLPDSPDLPVVHDDVFWPADAEVFEAMSQPPPGEQIEVVESKGFVEITSTVDMTAEITGDVRDGTIRLHSGQTVRRKLTSEGNGWVEINGRRWGVTGVR